MTRFSTLLAQYAGSYLIVSIFLFSAAVSRAQTVSATKSEMSGEVSSRFVPPKVEMVNEESIRDLLKPKDKPLLVNFWATWCEPCQEEFPDLVKIDRDYKGKIDFITISIDDPVEIDRDVPRFLTKMKSTIRAYLLKTADENLVIGSISDEWQGGMPFTVLYDKTGRIIYSRQGVINPLKIRAILDHLVEPKGIVSSTEFVRSLNSRKEEAVFFYRNNWKVIREAALRRGMIKSFEMIVIDVQGPQRFDIVLTTRFEDKQQYESFRENLRKLIKEFRPEGPLLMNKVRPDDFRKSLYVRTGVSFVAGTM